MDEMVADTPFIPVYGGMLALNPDTGIAGCLSCGWRGLPNREGGTLVTRQRRGQNPVTGAVEIRGGRVVESVPSTFCPVCESDMDEIVAELIAERRRDLPRVPRNAPCPCGSGKKAKKCDCGRYAC